MPIEYSIIKAVINEKVKANNNITVKCGSGAIQLLEVKPLPNISIGDHL